jgi:hypothetical protein
MSGEQLPPVVVTITGDDAEFLDMLDRDVASLQAAAGEIDALLAGLDLGAALADSLSTANLGSLNTDQIAQGLTEGAAGIGDAMGADIAHGLETSLGGAGTLAGDEIGQAIVEGAVGAGDTLAAQLASELQSGAERAGGAAGEILAESIVGPVSLAGSDISQILSQGLSAGLPEIDAQVSALMRQLPAVIEPDAVYAGLMIGGGLAAAAGVAASGLGGQVAQSFAEAVASPLETAMTEAGMAAADALAAGMESAGTAVEAAASSLAADFTATVEADTAAGSEQAGRVAGAAYAQGWGYAALSGVDLIEQGIGTIGIPMPGSAAAAQAAQAALAAAAQREAEEIAAAMVQDEQFLQQGIDNFLTLGGQGLDEWLNQVQLASETAKDAFISVYEAVNAQLEATTALTDEQAAALDLMYYRARTEMDALQTEALAFNQSVDAAANGTHGFAPTQGIDLVEAGIGTSGRELGGLASGAEEATAAVKDTTSAFGGMASMMYGPWGMAAFAAMSILPMLSGMFNSTSVSAADFTQVLQQDSGAVGDNTAATIQSTLAKTDLSAISGQLGISQATLIEYAAGESQAQQTVTAAYQQKQQALSTTTDSEQIHSKAQLEGASAAQVQSQNLQGQKAALDQVTAAVQQAIVADQAQSDALLAAEQTTQIYDAAVKALGSSMLLQVQQTKMSNQATAEYGSQILFAESSTSYMTAAMQAAVAANRESALTSAYASVALLGLGTSQTELNAQLAAGETMYTEAQSGAQAYNTALTSLNGTVNTLLGAEASFTTTLSGLTTTVKANGDSLDVNTAKGAANITAITGIATSAQAAAVAVYQNDVATGNASKAYQDATTTLQHEKQAFIDAGEKAGLNKQAVQQLADELFKLPPSVSTTIHVDTSAATNNLDNLYSLIDQLQGAGSTLANSLDVTAAKQQSKLSGARASGGPVEEGHIYRVNESGEEGFFTAPANGYIIPHEQFAAIGSGVGAAVSSSGFASGGGGSAPQVNVRVYLNSQEISAEVRTDVQQYASHNSQTGFAGVGR